MAKSMTPSKRHAMRAMYEAKARARKNERLGIKPKASNKKGKRKDLKGFFYRFYLWIWHSLFIRKCCLKIYRSFRREK